MPLKPESKSRDVGLDGLRTIGLLAIILAHVDPPGLLFQIRNFDVPLMILISGAVFNLSSGSSKSYWSYFKSRVGRLLIPTWIFLSIFFALVFAITKAIGQTFPYSRNILLESFDLSSGTGYVWIIRVFIPLLLISFFLYEFLLNLYPVTHLENYSSINFFVQYILFYIIPYGIVAGLGFYITKLRGRSIGFLAIMFGLIFAILAFSLTNPQFVPTQNFKYPPQAYYFSYALFVSLILYLVSKTEIFKKIFSNKILMFISSSSLWIFLWQILYLFIWTTFRRYLAHGMQNFVVEYFFVLMASILTTYFQKTIFNKIVLKLDNYESLKNFSTIAFLR